ncbi:MAG: apolipoprotein N-acyltransferase [Alphaproteobacteria bacterium]
MTDRPFNGGVAFVTGLPGRLGALGPWRRRGLLFGLGAATVLGLPPVDAWPVAFLTLPMLIWLLESAQSRKQAFGTGWWFLFGYFAVGWYWISNALLVFSASLAWMIPFALIGLPGALAIYGGLALLIPHILLGPGPQRRVARVLLTVAALAGADIARGFLLTGFPWNVFGYLWSGTEALSQSAALFGVYGIGLLVLLSGALPALAANGGRKAIAALAVAVAIPLLTYAGGAVRLADAPDLAVQQADPALPGLRMVQANVPQREKWRHELRERNLQIHLLDSSEGRPDWVGAVLWPETAAAFLVEDSDDYRAAMARYAVPENGYLITGTPRRTRQPVKALFNSVVAIDDRSVVRARYDKAHLVPFGEYVPLAKYMPFGKVAAGEIDYSPGPGPRTIRLAGLPPVSPLICYEVIFPSAVTDPADRPAWLLNVTNDAWYGRTAGPYQHLQHARMRAVEEGLPLVRPANTGISIAFDGYGREIGRIPLETRGVLDLRLPPSLAPTVFAQWGMTLPLVMLVLLVAGGLFARRIKV